MMGVKNFSILAKQDITILKALKKKSFWEAPRDSQWRIRREGKNKRIKIQRFSKNTVA